MRLNEQQQQEKLDKILALIDSGLSAGKACKKEKVNPGTYYLWKNKFGSGAKSKKGSAKKKDIKNLGARLDKINAMYVELFRDINTLLK